MLLKVCIYLYVCVRRVEKVQMYEYVCLCKYAFVQIEVGEGMLCLWTFQDLFLTYLIG